MPVSETYIDPALDDDVGSGTPGDPYGDVQFALNDMTRDAVNGDRLNIKAGTPEVLTGSLDLTSYGIPAWNVPLIFQGYTATAGDGGIGEIDGNGSAVFNHTSRDGLQFYDLKMGNSGGSRVITARHYLAFGNLEIHTSTTSGIYASGSNAICWNCHFHNLGNDAVNSVETVENCYFDDCGIWSGIQVDRNIIYLTTAGRYGIYANLAPSFVRHNSVLHANGNGTMYGILISGSIWRRPTCHGNIVEGFNGTGGDGIRSIPDGYALLRHNAAFDNDTNYDEVGDLIQPIDNESLPSSAFAKSGSPTFANRFEYFRPLAVGNVLAGMPDGSAKGAVPPLSGGGASGDPLRGRLVL